MHIHSEYYWDFPVSDSRSTVEDMTEKEAKDAVCMLMGIIFKVRDNLGLINNTIYDNGFTIFMAKRSEDH